MKLLLCNNMKFSAGEIGRLEELGFETAVFANEREKCPEELFDCEAVVCYRFFCYNDISRFKRLRLIHTTSAGLDHMPMDYIQSNGIRLYNAGGVYSAPIAEFVLGGVLQFYKQAPRFRRQQGEHIWKQSGRLLELEGKHVCIVGAGSIGTETAKRFSAMGCSVAGLCRRPEPKPYFDRVEHISNLDAELEKSDIVVLTLPLTGDTKHMFDEGRFARMKKGAVFVNVSRGPVCDTGALIKALDGGLLMGTVLDVFEEEPLPGESPFWDMDNVILTPHNSFSGDLNNRRMMELIYSDFKAYLASAGGN